MARKDYEGKTPRKRTVVTEVETTTTATKGTDEVTEVVSKTVTEALNETKVEATKVEETSVKESPKTYDEYVKLIDEMKKAHDDELKVLKAKAEEARKAEEAKKAEEARKAEEAKKAEKAAKEARTGFVGPKRAWGFHDENGEVQLSLYYGTAALYDPEPWPVPVWVEDGKIVRKLKASEAAKYGL